MISTCQKSEKQLQTQSPSIRGGLSCTVLNSEKVGFSNRENFQKKCIVDIENDEDCETIWWLLEEKIDEFVPSDLGGRTQHRHVLPYLYDPLQF